LSSGFFDEVRPLGTAERKQRDEVLEKVNVFLANGLKDR
jgi:hypothetical protein